MDLLGLVHGQIQSCRPTLTSVGRRMSASCGRQSERACWWWMTKFRTASRWRVSARLAFAAATSCRSWTSSDRMVSKARRNASSSGRDASRELVERWLPPGA